MDNGIKQAAESWKELNLQLLLQRLDQGSLDIIANQKESLIARKSLAEQTKGFRKLSDEQKIRDFKKLFKEYQTEIDNLTKRMKSSEKLLLDVFEKLQKAPDPHPFIQRLVDVQISNERVAALESDNARLKSEVAALAVENKKLRSQESRATQLQQQLESVNSKMQELVKTQVMQREEEIKQESDNLIQYLKEREGDLQKQLADAKWQLDKLRATHNSTQAEILDQSQQADHDIIAKLAEMDILQSDIDRANGRIADLQAQNRSLHNEIQALKQGFGTDALVSEYRQQIEDQESDIARLMDEIEEIKHLLDIQEAKQQAKVEEMAAQIASKDKQIRSLEGVVRSREDYDEVKRELDILKSVEFAYSDWGMNDESNSQGEEPNQPLEKLLARKNKKLQDELVSIKARLSEVETDAAGYKESEEELRKTVAEKDVLIKKLEDSLSSFDSRQPEASMESEGPSNGASSASIIPIITDQRNRFKQRNSELEEELRMQQNAMADLRSQIDKLRRDNVKLYEETQYLRNYSARKATTYTSPSTSQRAEFDVDDGQSMPDTTVINIGAGRGRRGREAPDMDSSSNKYKDLYEESLNPFHRFHRREAARRFRSMNILDRGTLMVTRKVLTSRFGRYAVIIYASLLHFLVMAALYRLSRAKDCPGASNTPGDLPLN